jgi:hypothetical protein
MARERQREPVEHTGGRQGADDAATAKPAGPMDELDRALEAFVASEGPTLGRGEALTKISTASQNAEKLDLRYAEDRYLIGESLGEFAAKKGHVALGYGSVGRCFVERFKLGRSWAYESIRLARAATRKDLEGMSWTVARLGLELLTLLEVDSFAALRQKPLPVPTIDGEPAFFPASPEMLTAAITELKRRQRTAPAPADAEEARTGERTAQRKAQRILEQHLAQHPELAEAKPSVFLHNGRAQLRIGSVELRAETFAAVARFFAEVEKTLRRE